MRPRSISLEHRTQLYVCEGNMTAQKYRNDIILDILTHCSVDVDPDFNSWVITQD